MRKMGFTPCIAEPDIWMRKCPTKDCYEYIATYVDDLAIAAADPNAIVRVLMEDYNFKLKGTGPISFHLGMSFYYDKDGTLVVSPKRFVEKVISEYERHFGAKPKERRSPLPEGDHPELDTSEFLDATGINQYQSIIGSLQWAITIGRIDIATAVMSLSSFHAAPRRGHLERAKHVCGYLYRMKEAAIRIRTDEPDYSELEPIIHDWDGSVYGEVKELLPVGAPTPRGKRVVFSHYVDANLYHDMLTGRSVTGALHFLNQTPVDWFSKKQATVETATYGSEFSAARVCVEQIIDLRTTLRYLGVPVHGQSYMFGDNKAVVDSSMTPHGKLNKRHTALSFHRVREAIASGMVAFFHIDGKANPADILSKHWSYSSVWPQLKPLLFWSDAPADGQSS